MTDVTPVAEPVTPANAPSLLDLFIAFATISASGFGGVLAWSRRVIVERRRWMTPEEFTEAYALCQFLPGPNVVNLSVVFGSRVSRPDRRGGGTDRAARPAVPGGPGAGHSLCAVR